MRLFPKKRPKKHAVPVAGMEPYADQLRSRYGLDKEPTDLSKHDLKIYRHETKKIRDAVSLSMVGEKKKRRWRR